MEIRLNNQFKHFNSLDQGNSKNFYGSHNFMQEYILNRCKQSVGFDQNGDIQFYSKQNQKKIQIKTLLRDLTFINDYGQEETKPIIIIVTEDKTTEYENLNVKEVSQFKTKLLSSVSHEVRTPLNFACSMMYVLSCKDDILPDLKINFLYPIYANLIIMENVVNDLNDYNAMTQGQVKFNLDQFNLRELIIHCQEIYQNNLNENQVKIIIDWDENIDETVNSDSNRIKQVLLNLISNSFKYTKKGFIKIKCCMCNNKIQVSIIDTGSGIDLITQNNIKKLINEINTDKFVEENTIAKEASRGLGLGLTVSSFIALGIGGEKMDFESEVEKGTTFKFYIINRDINKKHVVYKKIQLFSKNLQYFKSTSQLTHVSTFNTFNTLNRSSYNDRNSIQGFRLSKSQFQQQQLAIQLNQEKIQDLEKLNQNNFAKQNTNDLTSISSQDSCTNDQSSNIIISQKKEKPNQNNNFLSPPQPNYLQNPNNFLNLGGIQRKSEYYDNYLAIKEEDCNLSDSQEDDLLNLQNLQQNTIKTNARDRLNSIDIKLNKRDIIQNQQSFSFSKDYLPKIQQKTEAEIQNKNKRRRKSRSVETYVPIQYNKTYSPQQQSLLNNSKITQISLSSDIALDTICQKCDQLLIVDDNDFNIIALKNILKNYQLDKIDIAKDGQEACDMVEKKFKNKNNCCQVYRLIFMDIDMPKKNGFEASLFISNFYKNNNVLRNCLITAHTAVQDQGDKKKYSEAGMKFFLPKPINIQLLQQVLNKIYKDQIINDKQYQSQGMEKSFFNKQN